jgi:hypothetical protein
MATTPMNALFHRATTCPDGTAFIYDEDVWTYYDLVTDAEQISRAFLVNRHYALASFWRKTQNHGREVARLAASNCPAGETRRDN